MVFEIMTAYLTLFIPIAFAYFQSKNDYTELFLEFKCNIKQHVNILIISLVLILIYKVFDIINLPTKVSIIICKVFNLPLKLADFPVGKQDLVELTIFIFISVFMVRIIFLYIDYYNFKLASSSRRAILLLQNANSSYSKSQKRNVKQNIMINEINTHNDIVKNHNIKNQKNGIVFKSKKKEECIVISVNYKRIFKKIEPIFLNINYGEIIDVGHTLAYVKTEDFRYEKYIQKNIKVSSNIEKYMTKQNIYSKYYPMLIGLILKDIDMYEKEKDYIQTNYSLFTIRKIFCKIYINNIDFLYMDTLLKIIYIHLSKSIHNKADEVYLYQIQNFAKYFILDTFSYNHNYNECLFLVYFFNSDFIEYESNYTNGGVYFFIYNLLLCLNDSNRIQKKYDINIFYEIIFKTLIYLNDIQKKDTLLTNKKIEDDFFEALTFFDDAEVIEFHYGIDIIQNYLLNKDKTKIVIQTRSVESSQLLLDYLMQMDNNNKIVQNYLLKISFIPFQK